MTGEYADQLRKVSDTFAEFLNWTQGIPALQRGLRAGGEV
jgi:hypothetical protein